MQEPEEHLYLSLPPRRCIALIVLIMLDLVRGLLGGNRILSGLDLVVYLPVCQLYDR
jgi:hypothetical protein